MNTRATSAASVASDPRAFSGSARSAMHGLPWSAHSMPKAASGRIDFPNPPVSETNPVPPVFGRSQPNPITGRSWRHAASSPHLTLPARHFAMTPAISRLFLSRIMT